MDSTPLLDAETHSRQFDGCKGLGEERLSLGDQDTGLLLRRLHGGGGGMGVGSQTSLHRREVPLVMVEINGHGL